MKKYILFLLLLSVFSICEAREPYGDYICRYILTVKSNDVVATKIYNPLKITHQSLEVKNTNKGTKTWYTRYQGVIRITSQHGSYRFHNFYLTKQNVEFSISDTAFYPYNGKYYYMIIFDGQYQLAEPAPN